MESSPKHILAVDDDEGVRDVIALMLQEQGFRVTAASDGLSMREMLQRDDPVDAIVLDALMPGEQYATLVGHARDLNIPVVMISGSHDQIIFARNNRLQLLRKPFRYQELIEAITEALNSGEPGQRCEIHC
jgi:two-component system nitrogen regulation response regulator NtrX